MSTLNGREVYLELEEVGEATWLTFTRPSCGPMSFFWTGPFSPMRGRARTLIISATYGFVRCAWATPQGKYASLFQEAQEKAKADGRGLWRP